MQIDKRLKNKRKIRKKIYGTFEYPRLTIFKSLKYLYAQIINDIDGVTICNAYSKDKNIASSINLAGDLAEKLKKINIKKVVFDRNGYKYQGVVKSFADTLREKGIII